MAPAEENWVWKHRLTSPEALPAGTHRGVVDTDVVENLPAPLHPGRPTPLKAPGDTGYRTLGVSRPAPAPSLP